jgi:hypothetical protein
LMYAHCQILLKLPQKESSIKLERSSSAHISWGINRSFPMDVTIYCLARLPEESDTVKKEKFFGRTTSTVYQFQNCTDDAPARSNWL